MKSKNKKQRFDTTEEIAAEFLSEFQRYAARAEEVYETKTLSPAEKLDALENIQTRYAALSTFFTANLGFSPRREDGMLLTQVYFNRIFYCRLSASAEAKKAAANEQERTDVL